MIGDNVSTGNSFAKFGSGRLLKDLLQYDLNGKYIFVGDFAQLPPIGQSFSPALSSSYIEENYNLDVATYSLTEIMRQSSSSGILKASLMVRKLFETNPKLKFASFPLKGFDNIKFYNSHLNLINSYYDNIKTNGFEHSTLICQPNKQCSDINSNIRMAFGRKSDKIEVEDIILVTQNFRVD